MLSRPIHLLIWGREALWTDPHFRADPMSYPAPTSGALKRLIGNLYSHPQFEIEVLECRLYSPVRFETRKQWRSTSYKKSETPTMQVVTLLRDPSYGVTFRLRENPLYPRRKPINAYWGEACRRMRAGQEFSHPCLGRTQYFARWEYVEKLPPPLNINMNIGRMLFDQIPLPGMGDRFEPVFFDAKIEDGVLRFPLNLHDRLCGRFHAARRKMCGDRYAT